MTEITLVVLLSPFFSHIILTVDVLAICRAQRGEIISEGGLLMDFLIDGQISSFCPDQLEAMLLTLIMLHKITESL